MSSRELLNDVTTDLELYRDFIIKGDIPQAIKGKCNYLAALGLSVYTEVFGGLYRGDLTKGNSKTNYNAFIKKYFSKEYMRVDSQLRADNLGGLYGAVRSGLVHEYLIKSNSIVVMYRRRPMKCGVTYNPNGNPKITFVVQQYFDDFKKAFYHYCNDVQKNPKILKRFVNALDSIDSPLPRSKKIF